MLLLLLLLVGLGLLPLLRLAVRWFLIPRGCVVWADRRMSSRPRRLSMSMSLSTSGTKAGAGDGIILEELFALALIAVGDAIFVVPDVSYQFCWLGFDRVSA